MRATVRARIESLARASPFVARHMTETDQLVAAIFSATMNAAAPTPAGLIAQYEYFLRELPARRRAAQQRAEESANAAWTQR